LTAQARIGIVLTGLRGHRAEPPPGLRPCTTVQAPPPPYLDDRLSRMLSLALLTIVAYAATNIDNLFVLLAFLAEAGAERRRVIVGQYAGSLILIAGSFALAALLTHLPPAYVGLLGFLPIAVGLSKAWERFGPGHARQDETTRNSAGNPATAGPATLATQAFAPRGSSAWTVACMAVANGSDNLAVYVPLYASHSIREGAFISLVFVVMVALWCASAVALVEHPLLGAPIRRYGTALLPLILIAIGASVIVQHDTLGIVFGI
jgi:cadmium resistance protein CadD (predicted permease)